MTGVQTCALPISPDLLHQTTGGWDPIIQFNKTLRWFWYTLKLKTTALYLSDNNIIHACPGPTVRKGISVHLWKQYEKNKIFLSLYLHTENDIFMFVNKHSPNGLTFLNIPYIINFQCYRNCRLQCLQACSNILSMKPIDLKAPEGIHSLLGLTLRTLLGWDLTAWHLKAVLGV